MTRLQETWGGARPRVAWNRLPEEENNHAVSRINLCSSARKVIGFTPIEPRMLEMQMECYGAENIEEAKLMEIKSYLKCEMKMRSADNEKLDIIKIFHPAKENWNVLYVELGSDFQVDMGCPIPDIWSSRIIGWSGGTQGRCMRGSGQWNPLPMR